MHFWKFQLALHQKICVRLTNLFCFRTGAYWNFLLTLTYGKAQHELTLSWHWICRIVRNASILGLFVPRVEVVPRHTGTCNEHYSKYDYILYQSALFGFLESKLNYSTGKNWAERFELQYVAFRRKMKGGLAWLVKASHLKPKGFIVAEMPWCISIDAIYKFLSSR